MATIVFAPEKQDGPIFTKVVEGQRYEGMVKAGRLNGIG